MSKLDKIDRRSYTLSREALWDRIHLLDLIARMRPSVKFHHDDLWSKHPADGPPVKPLAELLDETERSER